MRLRLGYALALLLGLATVANAQTTTLYNGSVSISSYSAPNPRGSSYFNSNISLSLTAGTTYDIRTAVAVTPAYSVDTYIYLLDPSGNVVGSDDDNSLNLGNPYGSQLNYTANVSGNFTLVVTTYGAGSSYSGVPVTVTYPTPAGGGGSSTGVPNVKLQLPAQKNVSYASANPLIGDLVPSVSRRTAVRPSIFATTPRASKLPIFLGS